MAQCGAGVVAFCGVVIDDIEDHLDPGAVQSVDHVAELGDGFVTPAGAVGGAVGVVQGEEADGVVTPVIREVPLGEFAFGHAAMHRK